MRKYTFGKIWYYESSDFFWDCPVEKMKKEVNLTIKHFTKRSSFRKILEVWGQVNELEGYVLLHAHGTAKNGKWVFTDGGRGYDIQKWIDQMDGKALAILLQCCNPENCEIHSERSIIIHPKDRMNYIGLIRGGHLRIYVPGEGYLESNHYRMRKLCKIER